MSRIDLIEMHAREKAGLSDVWIMYRWACCPGQGPTLYYEVEGAVVPIGPRTGRPNFKKKDKSTIKTVIILVGEQNEWESEWSRRTGHCVVCLGTGKIFQKWSREDGTTYRPCPKCGGVPTMKEEEPLSLFEPASSSESPQVVTP